MYSFTNGSDAGSPTGALVMDSAGNLYGMTAQGGANRAGTAFKIAASGAATVLYSFSGVDQPQSGRISSPGPLTDFFDNLYGTTQSGGIQGDGSVFEIQP